MMEINRLLSAFGGLKPIDGDKFVPMPQDELVAVELGLGSRLPESYRWFLMNYGATTPCEIVYYEPLIRFPAEVSPCGRGYVAIFYGTKSDVDEAYSLTRRIRFFGGRIPSNMIPIGDDGGGGQILLGVSGKEAAKVYFWDIQGEPLDEAGFFDEYGKPRPPEAMLQNVHFIADSFEGFLSRIKAG